MWWEETGKQSYGETATRCWQRLVDRRRQCTDRFSRWRNSVALLCVARQALQLLAIGLLGAVILRPTSVTHLRGSDDATGVQNATKTLERGHTSALAPDGLANDQSFASHSASGLPSDNADMWHAKHKITTGLFVRVFVCSSLCSRCRLAAFACGERPPMSTADWTAGAVCCSLRFLGLAPALLLVGSLRDAPPFIWAMFMSMTRSS